MADTPKVKIERMRVVLDAPIHIFEVTISTKSESWRQSFGCEDALKHFLQGVKLASSMLGHRLEIPEIPGLDGRNIRVEG